MIIRSRTLKGWMQANFDNGQLEDIARHGCDAGWPGLTYYTDTGKLYAKFASEIWQMASDMANEMGEKNVLTLIAGFGGADNVSDGCTFENLMVWFACEQIAREMTD
jgi:hypothetical protein